MKVTKSVDEQVRVELDLSLILFLLYLPITGQLLLNNAVGQRCAGAGVQESIPAGVGVLQQEPEQDQE